MKRFILNILVTLSFACSLFAQSFEVIQAPHDPDSSYYDVFRLSENEFWAAGENGILVSFDSLGTVRPVRYPSLGIDLLKIDTFNNNEVVVTGKSGVMYIYNKSENSWEVIQVKGYENKAFYETAIVDENTILIAGGMSKIADSKKTLPRGFIIRSQDKGQTWEKLYSNPLAMVWDVDVVSDSFIAVIYNPLSKNRLLTSSDGKQWKKKRNVQSGLYHQFDEHSGYLAGGEGISMNGNAMLTSYKGEELQTGTNPFWWSIRQVGGTLVGGGSNGEILIFDEVSKILTTGFNIPFYEIALLNHETAFLIGSWQTIVKVKTNSPNLYTTE